MVKKLSGAAIHCIMRAREKAKLKEIEQQSNPLCYFNGIDIRPGAVNPVYQTRKMWVEVEWMETFGLFYWMVVIKRVNGKGRLKSSPHYRKIDAVNAAKSLARQLNIEYREAK